MDWASKPAACVHVFNTCIYLLCNIFKWYTTKYPTNQSYFLGIDIQYWSCFLTLLTPNVSKLLILLIVLLTPSLEAHLDWKRNFLCQQRESQTWNNLTSATKENMMNKLCDRTLQTAQGIGGRLCIRDTEISQPVGTQTSPLSFLSVVPGQERKDWHHRYGWLDESKLDCVLLRLWTPTSMTFYNQTHFRI